MDDPKMTYPTRYFEEESGVQELIEEYDDESFWDELANRLSDRDFVEKYSEDEIKAMDREEYFRKNMECLIEWEDEFEKHGLERLRADTRPFTQGI